MKNGKCIVINCPKGYRRNETETDCFKLNCEQTNMYLSTQGNSCECNKGWKTVEEKYGIYKCVEIICPKGF